MKRMVIITSTRLMFLLAKVALKLSPERDYVVG